MAEGEAMTTALPLQTARIRLALTGRIVGGSVSARHDDGTVTIRWAGLKRRGVPITLDEMLCIEAKGAVS